LDPKTQWNFVDVDGTSGYVQDLPMPQQVPKSDNWLVHINYHSYHQIITVTRYITLSFT
jgi:hypothetical protein